jgi:hypothetical protein
MMGRNTEYEHQTHKPGLQRQFHSTAFVQYKTVNACENILICFIYSMRYQLST